VVELDEMALNAATRAAKRAAQAVDVEVALPPQHALAVMAECRGNRLPCLKEQRMPQRQLQPLSVQLQNKLAADRRQTFCGTYKAAAAVPVQIAAMVQRVQPLILRCLAKQGAFPEDQKMGHGCCLAEAASPVKHANALVHSLEVDFLLPGRTTSVAAN